MPKDTRIPTKATEFAPYMDNTDDLQLAANPTAPPPQNFQKFGWTAAESAQWTAFRKQSDKLFQELSDKKKSSTDIKDQMKILIKNVKAYDHDKLNGHKLLDKVALGGTTSDCETFRVKRSTALAKSPAKTAGDPGTLIPVLFLRRMKVGEHLLTTKDPDKKKTEAIPHGMKFCKVYRFIGTAAPTSIKQYEFIVNAKRGLALSKFSDLGLDPNLKLWAWYIARYESSTGKLGDPSSALKVDVSLQDETSAPSA
ncbi:MAG: hypothetical protein HY063_09995 [Bacteroidetes bacterium]|nr:hypothetical protein [Bacteroidota bacterium]